MDEVGDEELLGRGPLAVPDEVDVDGGGGEDGAHVVAEVDEVGGALEFLIGGEGAGRELGVEELVRVQGLDGGSGGGIGEDGGGGEEEEAEEEGGEIGERHCWGWGGWRIGERGREERGYIKLRVRNGVRIGLETAATSVGTKNRERESDVYCE